MTDNRINLSSFY